MNATVKPRTQSERRQTAEAAFLDQAVQLLHERGYSGFTLADVAEAAGYSRSLPTHYFGNKENLLARVAEHVVESYNIHFANLPQEDRGLPTLVALVRSYVDGGGITMRTVQALIAQALIRRKLQETIMRLNAEGMMNIELEIRAGIAQGNIRQDVDPVAYAPVIYSFLRGQMAFAAQDKSFDQKAAGEEFIVSMCSRLKTN